VKAASAVKPEIPFLVTQGMLYPPSSLILVEATPYSQIEVVFLEFVYNRLREFPDEVLAASLREDLKSSLLKSSVQTLLVMKYIEALKLKEDVLVYFEDPLELIEWLESSSQKATFIYAYLVDPTLAESTGVLERLSIASKNIVKQRDRVQLTLFVDESIRANAYGRRLEYLADIVFQFREKEGVEGGTFRVLKTKFLVKPAIQVDYSVRRDGLIFEAIREI